MRGVCPRWSEAFTSAPASSSSRVESMSPEEKEKEKGWEWVREEDGGRREGRGDRLKNVVITRQYRSGGEGGDLRPPPPAAVWTCQYSPPPQARSY